MAHHCAAKIRMGLQGHIVIPAELRRVLHLEPGEILVGRIEHERLVLERRASVLDRLQARFVGTVPSGVSLSDELLADRRRVSETA